MNAADARSTAAEVINDLTEEPLPGYVEQVLLEAEGVIHLANALRQLEYAEKSGVAREWIRPAETPTEGALRLRCVDVLRDDPTDCERTIESLRPEAGEL